MPGFWLAYRNRLNVPAARTAFGIHSGSPIVPKRISAVLGC